MLTNFHTHTTFCDGKQTVEENILTALEKNFVSLGFSIHGWTPYELVPVTMETEELYKAEVKRMQEKYAGQIGVYKGIELDYYSEADPKDFDYRMACVHYIVVDGVWYPIDHSEQDQRICIENAFGGDPVAMADRYFSMLCEHVERCKPTLVGHFDVITKFNLLPEDSEEYRSVAGNALKRTLKACPYVELNTGGIARGFRTMAYPCDYLLDTLREFGGEVMLGSDSHNKNNLIFGFDEAVQRLKNAGFDHIVQFNGNGFDRFEI